MKREYNYRGIYDKDEVGRINDLLGTQRELFIERRKKTASKTTKSSKILLDCDGSFINYCIN